MKTNTTLSSLILLLAVMLTACGGPAATPEAEMPHEEKPTSEQMAHDTPAPDAMLPHDTTPTTEAIMESPAWFDAALTDVRTGQAFSLNNFKGKVILVETMAVWCPKCYTQQAEIQSLHTLLGERDDFVSITLDIDPNEDFAILRDYVEQTGFDWMYAVAPADVAREIALANGDQFLNPPSTPILIVDRHGVAHPLPFGIKSAADLMQAIQPFLDESM
jgi:cytochrome oxidase Cu insertion factor (SCO1/SenC/PrrC family)